MKRVSGTLSTWTSRHRTHSFGNNTPVRWHPIFISRCPVEWQSLKDLPILGSRPCLQHLNIHYLSHVVKIGQAFLKHLPDWSYLLALPGVLRKEGPQCLNLGLYLSSYQFSRNRASHTSVTCLVLQASELSV